jgi:hypothetical protein
VFILLSSSGSIVVYTVDIVDLLREVKYVQNIWVIWNVDLFRPWKHVVVWHYSSLFGRTIVNVWLVHFF